MMEVDIKVPDSWASGYERDMSPAEYFSEMSPIFATSEVSHDHFSDVMKEYIDEVDGSKKPRRLLVGGMSAKKMMIITPLLKWYIDHGLEVSKSTKWWNMFQMPASRTLPQR